MTPLDMTKRILDTLVRLALLAMVPLLFFLWLETRARREQNDQMRAEWAEMRAATDRLAAQIAEKNRLMRSLVIP